MTTAMHAIIQKAGTIIFLRIIEFIGSLLAGTYAPCGFSGCRFPLSREMCAQMNFSCHLYYDPKQAYGNPPTAKLSMRTILYYQSIMSADGKKHDA
jgi:hypothetical protein